VLGGDPVLTYGPHDEPDPVPTVVVGRSRVEEEHTVPVHPGLLKQRRAMNHRAAGEPRRIVDRRPVSN
jgi:hypothetical protein